MRNYITEKVKNTTRSFRFGDIQVKEIDPIPEDINIQAVFKAVENNFPPHYFYGLKSVKIEHLPEFDEREVNAVYRDQTFHITNRQSSAEDLMDDIVHEFAHHIETIFPVDVYGDRRLIDEFLKKRKELKFELQSEGYWVNEYNFDNLKFDSDFDIFLYKRVGKNMLRLVTAGMFIRPYAAVSLREYFATGFEAYYLGKRDTLAKISPALYDKITELHNFSNY